MHGFTSRSDSLEAVLSRPGRTWTRSEFERVTRDLLLLRESRDRQLATIVCTLRTRSLPRDEFMVMDILHDFYVAWYERGCGQSCIQRYDPALATTSSPHEAFLRWVLGAVFHFVRTWLKRNADSLIDRIDADDTEDAWMVGLDAHDASPEDQVLREEVARAIADCIESLEPRQAMAFRLRFLWGFDPQECARRLDVLCENGCSLDNEKQLVHRARMAMRKCLQRKGMEL